MGAYVEVPLRLRPNRVRALLRFAFRTPIVASFWFFAWQFALLAPRDSGVEAAIALSAGVISFLVGMATLPFALAALMDCAPGAPFKHIQIYHEGVTIRDGMRVRTMLWRDLEQFSPHQDYEPIRTDFYLSLLLSPYVWKVVGGRGVFDPRANSRDALLSFKPSDYAPLGMNFGDAASKLAGWLDGLARRKNLQRQIEAPLDFGGQCFALSHIGPEPAPRETERPAPKQPVRLDPKSKAGMAAYWRSEALQAARHDDDAASEYASMRAMIYARAAKAERKAKARARKAARAAAANSETR